MLLQNNRNKNVDISWFSAVGLMLAGMLLLVGCGGSEQTPAETTQAEPASAPVVQGEPIADTAPEVQSEPVAETAPEPTIPAPTVPADAPLLGEIYPTLTSGALQQARLTDLADDVLLQAEGVSITKSDLQGEFEQAPAEVREELRKNAFFILDQKATMEILTAMARKKIDQDSLPQDQLLQKYFDGLMGDITVTDAEIEAFYEENRDLVGNAPLDEVESQIEAHLAQQKQQQTVEDHIAELGKDITIALDAAWVEEQAEAALDNPVDLARANGIPTFVNFGAKGCRPCDMMEPLREEIKEEYAGKLNVVFVHVNQDQMLASRYGVRGIPHLVFFDKDGKQIHTHTGFMPKEQIEEWVKKSGAGDA